MKLTIRCLIVLLITSFFLSPSCKPVDYSDDINALKARTDSLKATSDSLAAALKITNANLQATNSALESLTTTVSSIQVQLGVIDTQISILNTQLSATNLTVTDHANMIASIQSEISVIQDQIEVLNTQQISTSSTINDLSTTIISIQTQIASILTQVATLNSQQTATHEGLSDIFEQLALSNSQLTTLSYQFNVLLTQMGLVIDNDGNIYHTVTIGTQVWMVENLRTTKFRNGDTISYFTATSERGYSWYNNDINNKTLYGALYNYYTATDIRGLCPPGWHIPTAAEWITLSNYLGGKTVAGGKLKETGTTHWQSPNAVITNSYGFNALPGGARDCSGNFINMGINCQFWTSAPVSSGSVPAITVFNDNTQLQIEFAFTCNNYSVRCIKD